MDAHGLCSEQTAINASTNSKQNSSEKSSSSVSLWVEDILVFSGTGNVFSMAQERELQPIPTAEFSSDQGLSISIAYDLMSVAVPFLKQPMEEMIPSYFPYA